MMYIYIYICIYIYNYIYMYLCNIYIYLCNIHIYIYNPYISNGYTWGLGALASRSSSLLPKHIFKICKRPATHLGPFGTPFGTPFGSSTVLGAFFFRISMSIFRTGIFYIRDVHQRDVYIYIYKSE